MTDFNSYVDPGVYVSEIATPVISTIGVSPPVVGIVADTQRYRTNIERVVLTATTVMTLTKTFIVGGSITVVDRYTGLSYVITTDYTLTTVSGVTTIVRVSGGAITSATEVLVSYDYVGSDYYTPREFTEFDSVVDTYGKALTTSGTINSSTTLAAYFAFLNGASKVLCAPVQAAASTPTEAEWKLAIDRTRTELDINVLVVIEGTSLLHAYTKSYVQTLESQGILRRAFVGVSDITPTVAEFQAIAATFEVSRITLIAPGSFEFFTGVTTPNLTLGGEYAAVAVAGSFASRGAQVPLTRKTILGFNKILCSWSESEMIQVQQTGITVLDQKRNGQIIVRHGLTTLMTNTYTQEISIQAAKDTLHTLIKDTLDAQNLVGSVQTADTPNYVISCMVGVLETCVESGLIDSYTGIKYRIPTNQPTLIQVRFMYKPSLPLNYIQVQFSIDTQTGTADFINLNA